MKEKRHFSSSGRLWLAVRLLAFVFVLVNLVGCSQAPSAAPAQAQQPAAAAQPTATQPEPPAATATATAAAPAAASAATAAAATATTLPSPTLPPTATATAAPTQTPTATPVPALALAENGFTAWCAPQAYQGTSPSGPDMPDYGNVVEVKNEVPTVKIPAAYCVISFKFNQAAPAGLTLNIIDAKVPFMKLPLKQAEGHPEQVWAYLNHQYVVNPPRWSVFYNLSVTAADGTAVWSSPIRFARPAPKNCQFATKSGNYVPDPVTGWCTITDPWEVEPRSYKWTPPPPPVDK